MVKKKANKQRIAAVELLKSQKKAKTGEFSTRHNE